MFNWQQMPTPQAEAQSKSNAAIQGLIEQAQELDMGYGAQSKESPRLADFNECPKNDYYSHAFNVPISQGRYKCRYCGIPQHEWEADAQAKIAASQDSQSKGQDGEG